MSAMLAILRISVMPAPCITSGWTILHPPPSINSRNSQRESRRSPVAIGTGSSRCKATIAFAFSNGIGSSNQPGRYGKNAFAAITALRGDSNSPHSTKISVSGPAPSRAAAIKCGGARDLTRLVLAQALPVERAPLEGGEAAPHGFLRAVEGLLRRFDAGEPVAGIGAQSWPERAAQQPIHRHAQALALQVPQRDVQRASAVNSVGPPRQRQAWYMACQWRSTPPGSWPTRHAPSS